MIVNSHNEWDTLKEVIVGDGFSTKLPVLDYSFRLFFHDNLWELRDYQFGDEFVTKRHVEEHAEDLNKFVELLESLNVNVKRPKVPKKIHKVSTPAWNSTIHPALNVRDMAMIVGDTIIESPPSQRYRYFENQLLNHLFLDYFKRGAKWIQAPKPIMTDNSFDMSYIDDSTGEAGYYDEFKSADHYLDCGHEIMFDAANCVRMGAHILMNVSNENQWLGAKWLQQTVGDEYTVWPVPLTDSHIDSTILPLRPGLALVMKPDIKDKLPKPLQSWDLIYVPMRNRSLADFEAQNLKLASPRIELNVLSVSPELIICHPQYESELNDRLKKYKIEAIGSPFRHCEIFSGAHHCTTLDTVRESKYENYF